MDLHRHLSLVREVAELASRELAIEQSLGGVSGAFGNLKLTFSLETRSGFDGRQASGRPSSAGCMCHVVTCRAVP